MLITRVMHYLSEFFTILNLVCLKVLRHVQKVYTVNNSSLVTLI